MSGLNSTQQSIVDKIISHENIHHKVNSLAGTGKTTTLIACVKALISQTPCFPENIVLVTFTRNAADEIAQRLHREELHLPWIGTFHSLSLKWLQASISFEQGVSSLPLRFLHRVQRGEFQEFLRGIKYLFVDEYQDVNRIQHDIILEFARHGSTVIGIGDSQQRIYGFRGSEADFFDHFFPGQSMEHRLDVNYRCTKRIIAVASTYTQFPIQPHGKSHPGHKPHVKYFSNLTKELLYLTKQIEIDIAKGVRPQDIAILSRSNSPLYKLEELLVQYKIPVTRSMKPGKVCLSTIHASKGLEWELVYIMGCNDNYFPCSKDPDDAEEDRRLFYVATTRAKKRLVYIYSGGKEYLTRFLTCVEPSHLQSHDICLVETKFLPGERDLSSCLKELTPVQNLMGNLETSLELDIGALLGGYQIQTLDEPLLIPDSVHELELADEFRWLLEYGLSYLFRGSLEEEESAIVSFFPKHQRIPDKERKYQKFGVNTVSTDDSACCVPEKFLQRTEDSLLAWKEKRATVQDHWNLTMTCYALRFRNRSGFFKAWEPWVFQSSWDRVNSFVSQNVWNPKDFVYHRACRMDRFVAEDILLHKGGESLLFFSAKETIEYEDLLTILLKTRVVCANHPTVSEILVFHVTQGVIYTFSWCLERMKEPLSHFFT